MRYDQKVNNILVPLFFFLTLLTFAIPLFGFKRTYNTAEHFRTWSFTNTALAENDKGPVVLGWFEDFKYPDGILSNAFWLPELGCKASVINGKLNITNDSKRIFLTKTFSDTKRLVQVKHYGRYAAINFKHIYLGAYIQYDPYGASFTGSSSEYLADAFQISPFGYEKASLDIPQSFSPTGYNTIEFLCDEGTIAVTHAGLETFRKTKSDYILGTVSGIALWGPWSYSKRNSGADTLFDWVHIVDTNSGRIFSSTINSGTNYGEGAKIYSVRIETQKKSGNGSLSYTFRAGNQGLQNMITVKEGEDLYFQQKGGDLRISCELKTANFANELPELNSLTVYYNFFKMSGVSVLSSLPASSEFVCETRYDVNLDSVQSPDIFIAPRGTGAWRSVKNWATTEITSIRKLQLSIDLEALRNETGVLDPGVYDVAVSNISAADGAIRIEELDIAEGILIVGSTDGEVMEKPVFKPNAISRSGERDVYLYIPIEKQAILSASIYNPAGYCVAELTSGIEAEPGTFLLSWDGKDRGGAQLEPGRYFAVVSINGKKSAAPVYVVE